MGSAAVAGIPMQELHDSSGLIDDARALAGRFSTDGYLFMRGVLAPEAVADVRRPLFAFLETHGIATGDDERPLATGESAAALGVHPPELHEQRLWERFSERPDVAAVFESILGEPVAFIPIAQYRFTPPATDPGDDPVAGRHQDGFYNEGIPFIIAWIPLMEIDEELGGIALAAGMHGSIHHDRSRPPRFPIGEHAIPPEAWHRTTYRPGDILIMNRYTPHSGLANTSDRVRLSMDLRVVPISQPVPIVGQVARVLPDAIVVRSDAGAETTLAVDEDTYIRGNKGDRLSLHDVEAGTRVMLAHQDGRATVIRPPT